MISLNNISLYFGGQTIFNDISFMVNKGDKIGLVGKNGVGKSTLLKVLSGEQSINSGDINTSNNINIGYLKQDLDFIDGKTVIEEAQSSFQEINDLEKSFQYFQQQLNERTDYESKGYLEIIKEFNNAEEKLRNIGSHNIHAEISQVLIGLGFSHHDFKRQTSEFSGGWRMRIEIAKILLQKPDLLLLDEPTNHLDIESIIWMEKWLKEYTGAIILVSHDRKFLDGITNRTIEVAFETINNYKAPYTKYLTLRKDRIEKQIQAKKNQDKFIKETQLLINKFRAKKNKAAFAQTLIKKLDRLDIIQIEQEDIGKINFQFPPAPHSGKVSLLMKKIGKKYGALKVLEDVNLEIERGEKLAFVGKNGEGKSTLAKIIVQEIDFTGKLELGHKVKVGYYAQNQTEFLDENKTVLDTIYDAANKHTSSDIRNILGSFLFSEDAVDKKVSVLSGGERARVALCKLLLDPVNLLVMDEPTNHLDITSKELLKQALIKYDGSLIIVSHDREFLQGLSNKVYEFKNNNIKEYFGDINTFLKEKDLGNLDQLESPKISEKINNKTTSEKTTYLKKKDQDKRIRKISNKIDKIENDIEVIEKELRSLDLQLSDPAKFKELSENPDIFDTYRNQQIKLKEMEKEWGKYISELDSLRQ